MRDEIAVGVEKTLTIRWSGAGSAEYLGNPQVTQEIGGAGSAEYLGNPQVTQEIGGAGRVGRRDAVDTLPAIA